MAVGYHAPTAAPAHETARHAQIDVLRTRQQVITESEPSTRSVARVRKRVSRAGNLRALSCHVLEHVLADFHHPTQTCT